MKPPGPTRARPSRASRLLGYGLVCLVSGTVWGVVPSPAEAQIINGRLMDLDSGQPIVLGLVMMFSEAGDSITATLTGEQGRFTLTSPDPGSFLLLASALGYKETPAGVFELGEGSAMTVEYRIAPRPLPIDEVVVSLSRPVLPHYLVRNGFVRRLQRGLGAFITPHDIEEAPAVSTEDLLRSIPGVEVGTVMVRRDEMIISRADMGDVVQIRSPTGGWCAPNVYVDGLPFNYDAQSGITLSHMVPLGDVVGIEVYRRPAEIPVEYSATQSGQAGPACGVLVFWTRQR